MTVIILVLLAINIPLALLFGVPGFLISRQRRKIRKELFVLQAMGRVASLRADLFRLVVEGKLAPDSTTFQTFYPLMTGIVRHPDHFDVTADAVMYAISREFSTVHEGAGRLMKESEAWTSEMKDIAGGTASVLADMARWRYFELVADNKLKVAWRFADFVRLKIWKYTSDGLKAGLKTCVGDPLRRAIDKGMNTEPVTAQLRAGSLCINALVTP